MASFVNACVFTAASAGTGSFVVSAALTGWMTPATAGAVNGATYRYRAYSSDQTQWEIGTGTYTASTTTLTRTVTNSSSGGATVNFTAPPIVALTSFAADISSGVEITGGTVTGLTNLTLASGATTPATNDAAALGTTSLMWSDLFLAAGGVVNWNNGDVTITNSSNALAFAGASSGYTFDVPIGLASGGTGATLIDPNADRILFWDDSAGTVTWLEVGTGLSLSGTLLSSTAVGVPIDIVDNASVGTGTTYNITNTSITEAYKCLLLVSTGLSHGSGTNQSPQIRISGDNGTTLTTALTVNASLFSSGSSVNEIIYIFNTDVSSGNRTISAYAASSTTSAGLVNSVVNVTTGYINYIRLQWTGGNFDAGTVSLFGFK